MTVDMNTNIPRISSDRTLDSLYKRSNKSSPKKIIQSSKQKNINEDLDITVD
jgi:hypothetical protein